MITPASLSAQIEDIGNGIGHERLFDGMPPIKTVPCATMTEDLSQFIAAKLDAAPTQQFNNANQLDGQSLSQDLGFDPVAPKGPSL